MKNRHPYLLLLSVIISALVILNIYLFNSNHAYVKQNRQLILQNDSLLSINLDLANELEKLRRGGFNPSGKVIHGKSVTKY